MGNQSLLLILALGVLALVGVLFFISGGKSEQAAGPVAPEVLSVEFPVEIQADGNIVGGKVAFRDPDGDIVWTRVEIVEADLFFPFEFDPLVNGQTDGSFEFSLFTLIPQEITLSVTLVDAEGLESEPYNFEFTALMPEGEF